MRETRCAKRLFVFAGERSGDLHGSHLLQALKRCMPELAIEGVAGPLMRAHALSGPLCMEDFEVMGFSDVLRALPKLYRHFYRVRDHILTSQPEGTLLIDYPGFNLRLAKALRRNGYRGKIIQYISPSVWAWGQQRIEDMTKTLDLLLSIYPFEAQYFAHTSLPVTYVGNPLCEYIKQYRYNPQWDAERVPGQKLIALFPGSRPQEIQRNLPLMLGAASHYHQRHPEATFGVSCVLPITSQIIQNWPGREAFKQAIHTVPQKYTYELMRASYAAMAKSGTITLELALHQCPTVVIYKLTTLNRLYAKYLLKLNLPHYCIVNILGGQSIFPELIESGLCESNLYRQLCLLTDDEDCRNSCIKGCRDVQALLGDAEASFKGAELVGKVLAC